MANNQNINKVVYGNQTLIDLTSDTVEPSNLLEGETAHDRSGTPVTGTAKQGHVIKDQDGTSMTQRSNLKFEGGFNVSDDSQNDVTKIKKDIPIDWEDWKNLTDQEAEGNDYYIYNEPFVNGKSKAEVFTKLWENPSPTSAFAAQTITLASDDYDFLMFVYKNTAGGTLKLSMITSKGSSTMLVYSYTTSSGIFESRRQVVYQSNLVVNTDNAYSSATGSSAHTQDNSACIPLAIYGFKKNIEFDFTAVIANVSTDASKCMVDENTSVADRLPKSYEITIPTTGYTQVSKTFYGVTKTVYQKTVTVDKDNNALTDFHAGMKEDFALQRSGNQSDFSKLYAHEIGEGEVTLYFTSAPTTAFNVLIREAV